LLKSDPILVQFLLETGKTKIVLVNMRCATFQHNKAPFTLGARANVQPKSSISIGAKVEISPKSFTL
jgi:hypothetical protein